MVSVQFVTIINVEIFHLCLMFICFVQAEAAQQEACDKFEQMSDKGKEGILLYTEYF